METLKERFRTLVKTAHPDVGGDKDYFIVVQNAYEQSAKYLGEQNSN